MIQHTIITTIVIKHTDLEKLILEVYGKPLQVIYDTEWYGRLSRECRIERYPLTPDQDTKLELFIDGLNDRRMLNILLQDLCNNGHLLEGNYLITTTYTG